MRSFFIAMSGLKYNFILDSYSNFKQLNQFIYSLKRNKAILIIMHPQKNRVLLHHLLCHAQNMEPGLSSLMMMSERNLIAFSSPSVEVITLSSCSIVMDLL